MRRKVASAEARSSIVFKIVKIPKPENLPEKRAGESKYPFPEMEVGDSFVVPYGEMKQDETPDQFRRRIYNAAREHARKEFLSRPADAKGQRKEFTAAVMPEDDKSADKRYVAGDVVVWRDQ
jgi:hypothetical protein